MASKDGDDDYKNDASLALSVKIVFDHFEKPKAVLSAYLMCNCACLPLFIHLILADRTSFCVLSYISVNRVLTKI